MAALLLVIASTAGAAGLGKLVVSSAMGEAFRAEIDLLSFPDERTAPTPRLASPDLYPLAGFRYNPVLSGASLNLRRHPDGRQVIEIVTARPVNEPFIYLLVELESNAVRIVRGYTVLLDPHGYRAPGAAAALPLLPAARSAAVSAAPPAVLRAPLADPGAPVRRPARRLEDPSAENAKTLAGMLERVAALEVAVQDLQRKLEKLDAAVPATAAAPAPKPEAAAPVAAPAKPAAATPAVPAAAVREPVSQSPAAAAPRVQGPDSMLNEALLVLGIILLGMLAWLAWVVWGRPATKAQPQDGN